MTIQKQRILPAALGAAVLGFHGMPAQAESTDLDWLAVAYVWGTDISVDARDRSIDVDFSDVVDKLEMAFLGRVETQGDDLGGFVDVVFLGVGDNSAREAADLNADLDMTLIDVAAVWSPAAERYSGVEVFGGLRYVDVNFDLVVDPVPPPLPTLETGINKSYTDILLGARYVAPINDRWRLVFSGDLSGGDTEGTWSLGGFGVYRTGAHRFYAGYRHLEVEIKASADERVTQTFSGPAVGYGFAF